MARKITLPLTDGKMMKMEYAHIYFILFFKKELLTSMNKK